MNTQLGLLDAVKDLLLIHPVFLLGIPVIGVILIKDKAISQIRIWILLLVFYYYLCVMLTNIVGISTLRESVRLTGIGESFFHPDLNLIPFYDGFSLGFLLNIVLFIPLGFLCPLISKRYQSVKNVVFIGCGLSFIIEISQLFTLYRATDIDDLITNTVGALTGYWIFRMTHKVAVTKSCSVNDSGGTHDMRYVPVIIIATAFILGFFS